MPNTDPATLHPTLIARLRSELSRVRPPGGEPRYLTSPAPIRAWRLAPVMLAIAFTGILALSVFAATGSPNPAVWTNRVETVINPPTPSPSPAPEPSASPKAVPAAPSTSGPTAPPAERSEPTGSTEHESPEPGDDQRSPNPSPSPSGDH
jgi:hypothetical protein